MGTQSVGIRQIGIKKAKAKVGPSFSWATYWTTLISATVENAAPTNFVLTFPSAKTSLLYTDFSVQGISFASGSWTGNVLTLVANETITYFDSGLVITFLKTGQTKAITNNVSAPATLHTYFDSQAAATKTVASTLVSAWADKPAGAIILAQATGTKQPIDLTTDGLNFNSDSSDDKLVTGAFTLNQPFTRLCLIKQSLYEDYRFCDGITGDRVLLAQSNNATIPKIKAYAGSFSGEAKFSYSWSIVTEVYNGASSKLQINDQPAITGNFGANALNGLTWGNRGDVTANGAKHKVKEIITLSEATSDANLILYRDSLRRKYSLKEIVLLGDSTMASHTSGPAITSLLAYNGSWADGSDASDTIAEQKTAFLVLGNNKTDAVFLMVGLNNVVPMTTPGILTAYQDLIDTIRTTIGVSHKIIMMTMIPCQYVTDAQYLALNEAIRGQGASPITGADGYIDTTTTALNAGDGTLAVAYDIGNHIHENEAGRQIIADLIDAKLVQLGLE